MLTMASILVICDQNIQLRLTRILFVFESICLWTKILVKLKFWPEQPLSSWRGPRTRPVYKPHKHTAHGLLEEKRATHFCNIRNMHEKKNHNSHAWWNYRQKMVSDELALNYCLISIIMHVNSISNELQLSGGGSICSGGSLIHIFSYPTTLSNSSP